MLALGLVETKGLLAAIEGADAMLKAADVRLLEKSLASGGLVTITIAGEVSAVAASVSAAVAAIERLPGSVLVSHHVIPRPDEEVEKIIKLRPDDGSNVTPPGGSTAKSARSAKAETNVVVPPVAPVAPAPKAEVPAVKPDSTLAKPDEATAGPAPSKSKSSSSRKAQAKANTNGRTSRKK